MSRHLPRTIETDSLSVSKAVDVAVPAGAPSWVTAEFIRQTIEVWQPYYPDPLTADDALSIIQNVSGLFDVLKRK